RSCRHLTVRGLMVLPPYVPDPEASRPYFRRLRRILEGARARHSGLRLDELSMGMTDDFEVAIEEGATLVRVGRALFGERRRQ
ncbi:MAG: alanine racemase, partial [Acidobacteriota bacterium]